MVKIGVLVAALLMVFSGTADAVELCAAIDSSASVSPDDFRLQLEGLASAVEDPAIITPNGSVTLSVVRFEDGAFVVIPAISIDTREMAETVAGWIRSLEWRFGHRTDIYSAIHRCMEQFVDPSDQWIIDISTDGKHSISLGTDPIVARGDAVAGGLDVLNAIGVGSADMVFLGELVWPQPSSYPPEEGFTAYVASFGAFVEAMREKVRAEVSVAVPVDIKPASCPNPLPIAAKGLLPVAISGTAEFDVLQVDPATIVLEGVAPVRWKYEDVSTPFDPALPKETCGSCTVEGPDGILDLTLKFDREEVAAALGALSNRDCHLLTLTANLLEGFGGRGITGSDVVRIQLNKEDSP
jgi:hypothetical protein